MTYTFSPEFVDALIDAIDRRRGERQESSGATETPQQLPLPHRLMEREAERSLMAAYRSARRVLSMRQASDVFQAAERRIARLKPSSLSFSPSSPRQGLSAQALAEIYRAGSVQGLSGEGDQE